MGNDFMGFGSNKPYYESFENYLEDYDMKEVLKLNFRVENDPIYYNRENGYGVFLGTVVGDESKKTLKIKGNFISPLKEGHLYQIEGEVSKYNGEKDLQIFPNKCIDLKPESKEDIIYYLKSLHGLNTRADLLYDKFGKEIMDILIEDPMKVAKSVRGIGKKTVNKWKEQLENFDEKIIVQRKLIGYGLSVRNAKALLKEYGEELIEKIEENPYFLMEEVDGFGFKKCDKMAIEVGFDLRGNFRIQAGILHALNRDTMSGHTFSYMKKLYRNVVKILWNHTMRSNITKEEVKTNFKELIKENKIRIVENDKVYLENLYIAEQNVARKVVEFSEEKPFNDSWDTRKELKKYLKENDIELAKQQFKAVVMFVENQGGLFLLLGNAGSGKTFTLKIIIEMLRRRHRHNKISLSISLSAPTGKAAKVASKATGINCKTVHRTLNYRPGEGFEYNEHNKLIDNLIIVDETSMLGIQLADNLLRAILNGSKVIFIGDHKQLPSVPPGNLLRDLMNCDKIKKVILNVPQRQKEDSEIIAITSMIIEKLPLITPNSNKNGFVLRNDNEKKRLDLLMHSIDRLIEKGLNLDEIQVLTPQKNHMIGVYFLNFLIQRRFNPINDMSNTILNQTGKINNKKYELRFAEGDKVIHIKNNYHATWYEKGVAEDYHEIKGQHEITNGETGIIEEIKTVYDGDDTFKRIIVKYDDGYIFYDKDFRELDHAYALTIHKSQGSQWRAVLVMLPNYMHPKLAHNNLIYTAASRPEGFLCIFSKAISLRKMVLNVLPLNRNSRLGFLISNQLATIEAKRVEL